MSSFEMNVLVVGGGQAGLAAAYHLKAAGLPFRIVDAGDRIGDSWRRRYTSLSLFTPRAFSALPGMPMDDDAGGYASSAEFADYLARYASRFGLEVEVGKRISRLTRSENRFVATFSTGETVTAGCVIAATGGFQVPVVPAISRDFDPDVVQLTADSYREPAQIGPGRVLVVGGGASGRDIAVELAATHPVVLATGKARRLLPNRLLGRSVWWWLRVFGLMKVSGNSIVGRAMRRADPFPNRDRNERSLRRKGVDIVPRLTGASDRTAHFADSSKTGVATVIWAVGYRDDTTWIEIPGAVGADGSFAHVHGVSPVDGLYFVGRPWQCNRASALVMGVGDDAAAIVDRIAGRMAR